MLHDDFDDVPTQVIPRETMREVVYGEGHTPIGPARPTRDIRAPRPDTDVEDFGEDTAVDDLSDGIPLPVDHSVAFARTEPCHAA